ncbi:phage portal protein [Planococcus sp. X10-3]|uniref:phage portal protein n=1 Tax=Planococcus sp. X10-3 TaxID=3061240 RepID=UPI003BB1D293
MVFIMNPEEEELDGELLKKFIDEHAALQTRYDMLSNMYKGQHDILAADDKDSGKPDNRLVVNFAKYIVDTLNGYFVGTPIKTVHPHAETADRMKLIAKRNSQNDNNAELAKMCSIYGHAYEFLYQDDEANTRVTYLRPQEAFVIYDDTIGQKPLYGVHAYKDKDDLLKGAIYSATDKQPFAVNDKGEMVIENGEAHYYGDVPLIEYLENEEKQSAFESVISLINAYNKALSEKANDVDYFADAYLSILGVEIDQPTLDKIRDNRIINLKEAGGDASKIVVEFLDKPNADITQENLIERLKEDIFQIAMVANISDENFGSSSGISLKYKLQPMENVALMKERKFTAGMMQRFKMMFNVPQQFTQPPESYLEIDYKFSRNIPNNLKEEAETVAQLVGILPNSFLYGMLSNVDNVQDVIDELAKQKAEAATNSYNSDMNTPFNEKVTSDGSQEE